MPNFNSLITFLTLMVGSLAWLFRLESRVAVVDQKHQDLKDLINERFDSTNYRLERIEKALNGFLHKE